MGEGVNYALCDGATAETVEHLFFDCPFSASCWASINMHWGGGTNRLIKMHAGKEMWTRPMFMEIFLTAAWSIWMERNDKIFRSIPHSLLSWKKRLRVDLALLAHRVKPSLVEFVKNFVDSIT